MEENKPKIDLNNPNFEYVDNEKRLLEVIEILEKEKMLAVDSEGTGLDPYLTRVLFVQIGTREKAYVIDARRVDCHKLKGLLENKGILKILQNAKYDYEVLKVKYDIEIQNVFDTMLAERIVTAGMERGNSSLLAIANNRLGITLDKDYESYEWDKLGDKGEPTERQLKYAAGDVLILFPIFDQQYAQIIKENLLETAKLEFRLIQPVADMEITGAYIDVSKWRENLREQEIKRNELAKKIQDEIRPLYKNTQFDLFGQQVDVINLNSQPQLLELLNDKLGLNAPSTGEEVLSKLNHPIAKMLLEYRGYQKMISAFGENLLSKIHKITGRIHPDFIQIGADSGRFACSNPNLQQIPRESTFRSCFMASSGNKLVTADYSQIELRVMGEYSQDPELMKAYLSGQDLHTMTASLMYGIPVDKVRKTVERQAAKTINFGLMYGRGANSLADQLGVSVDEARNLMEKYFTTFKKVKKWLDTVAKETVKKGYSVTLVGRKRWFRVPDPSDPMFDRLISHIERQGKNTPIQGSSADMTKFALIYIYDRIKKDGLKAHLILTVHDEVVIEVLEADAEKARAAVEEEMKRAGRQILKTVPVECAVEVADLWQH